MAWCDRKGEWETTTVSEYLQLYKKPGLSTFDLELSPNLIKNIRKRELRDMDIVILRP